MIIVYFLILILLLFFNIKSPTYYLIFYLILTTKFLGFIDFSSTLLFGREIGFFGINVLTLVLSLNGLIRPKPQLKLNGVIVLVFILLSYGMIKPLLLGTSSTMQSIIASKDFWYYAIFFYILAKRNKMDVFKIIFFIKWLGIYLSFLYIIGLIIPDVVPSLYYDGSSVRASYPTYIVLAIYLLIIDRNILGTNFLLIIKIGFCFLGLFLSGRLSLNFATVVGVVFLIYGLDKNFNLNNFSLLKLLLASIILAFFFIIIYSEFFNILYELVSNIINGTDAAVSSRVKYNVFRWDAIKENKWFGYGFIHHSSGLMNSFDASSSNRFMKSFGVIDSGYVDLLIKFGWIGLIVYFLSFGKFLFYAINKINKSIYTVVMTVFLTSYVFINYTWSVFTYPIGIVPMAVAVLIICKSIESDDRNIKTFSIN